METEKLVVPYVVLKYLIVMILIYILSFLLREFLHRDNLLTSFSRSIFFLVLFVYNSYHLLLE